MVESREYLKKPQTVRLNWGGSKEYLARYVQSLGGHGNLDGLIYDLGHYGRNFDDFGKDILIQCNKARFLDPPSWKGQRLEAIMKLKSFLSKIAGEIDKYSHTHESILQELSNLQELTASIDNDRTSKLLFDREWNGFRTLQSIEDYFE